MSHVAPSTMVIMDVIKWHHVLPVCTSLDKHSCLVVQSIIHLTIAECLYFFAEELINAMCLISHNSQAVRVCAHHRCCWPHCNRQWQRQWLPRQQQWQRIAAAAIALPLTLRPTLSTSGGCSHPPRLAGRDRFALLLPSCHQSISHLVSRDTLFVPLSPGQTVFVPGIKLLSPGQNSLSRGQTFVPRTNNTFTCVQGVKNF